MFSLADEGLRGSRGVRNVPNATWLESSRAGLGSKPSGSWDPNSSVACCSDRKWPPERRVIRPRERGKGTQSRACLKRSSGRVAGAGAWRRSLAGTALGSWKGRRCCRWTDPPHTHRGAGQPCAPGQAADPGLPAGPGIFACPRSLFSDSSHHGDGLGGVFRAVEPEGPCPTLVTFTLDRL